VTDLHIGLLVIAVWGAALVPTGDSLGLVALAGAGALFAYRRRRPLGLILAATLMASFGAGAAWARIEPVESHRYEGEATLVGDPAPVSGGVRVAAEIDGQRYDLRAWGSPAGWLRDRLMGEQVQIKANLRPLGDAPDWLLAQGMSGRGTVTSVGGFKVGSPHTRLANSIRRTIESGASSLDRDQRALFAGLVYGDDREQSPLTADNFEAAGLTHLLAVSGQNVAFVLVIAGPVLRRLGYRGRFVFVLAVLLLFATVTRFEPSVIRASVMTAVAAVAVLVGTEVSSRRILGLAISLLILVDPLMVHSVAFQLSVAASAGILLWSGRVARAVPGPRVLAESLAVTATAQLAVAPLLVWRFDGLPVASLPSNLLAGPAAGPVMMWGLTGGLLAGVVPSWLAGWLHVPTRAAVWWIDSVAGTVPDVPLGRLGGVHVVLLFAAGAFGLRQAGPAGRSAAAVVLVVVLLHPGVMLLATPASSQMIDGDSIIWRDETTTVVELDSATRPQKVLSALRASNVEQIDLVIVHQSSFANAALIGWIRTHHHIASIWAPKLSMGVGETVPVEGSVLLVDGVTLTIEYDDDKLWVRAVIDD
jgi:competence protein ComEC